jgi:hypothetical protein
MRFLALWQVPLLGTVVVLGIVAAVVLVRVWPRRGPVSAEEREEMANAPMSPSQKGAWCGLLIGVVTFATITALLVTKGAAEYWENDDLRLTVVAIFIGGIVAHPIVSNLFRITSFLKEHVDEREDAIVSRASIVQPPAILITLAAWLITLTQRYHEQGAVPVVYLYLMFGSVILVLMISQSVGVLLGHRIGGRHGES